MLARAKKTWVLVAGLMMLTTTAYAKPDLCPELETVPHERLSGWSGAGDIDSDTVYIFKNVEIKSQHAKIVCTYEDEDGVRVSIFQHGLQRKYYPSIPDNWWHPPLICSLERKPDCGFITVTPSSLASVLDSLMNPGKK